MEIHSNHIQFFRTLITSIKRWNHKNSIWFVEKFATIQGINHRLESEKKQQSRTKNKINSVGQDYRTSNKHIYLSRSELILIIMWLKNESKGVNYPISQTTTPTADKTNEIRANGRPIKNPNGLQSAMLDCHSFLYLLIKLLGRKVVHI